MSNIYEFNKLFPTAVYRIVHVDGKHPVSNSVYDLDGALTFIKDKNIPYRLGWLVDSDHIVVDVDCDPTLDPTRDKAKRVFEILKQEQINSFLYTTPRGMHCIFRKGDYNINSTVKAFTMLGIRIDIRVQGSYVILPHNDEGRKWWSDSTVQMDEIPYFLKIITKVRTQEELWGLSDGSGRNDALYRILQVMKMSQLYHPTSEEMKATIVLINKYIFKEPMSDRELFSTILRPENLIVKENKAGTNLASEYAITIAQEQNLIYAAGSFFKVMDESNIYRQMSDEELDRFIYLHYAKGISSRTRDEIIKALRHEVYIPWEECNRDPYDIPFLNGVYNAKSGGFRPILPSDNFTYVLPHRYNPKAQASSRIGSFIKTSLEDNIEKIRFFFFMLGYCMTRSSEYQVFFVFKGRGGTGKSTLLEIVQNILGIENVAFLQLTDFTKNFGLEALFNKLANLGDDISGTKLVDSQTFKKASSGDVINVDRKHKTAISFAPFAKIIFTSNAYPKIVDKSRAMERRMRIVGSDRVIPPDEIIPNFVGSLTPEDYESLINEALKGINYLLTNKVRRFPDPDESERMKEKMRQIGDHVYAFMRFHYSDQNLKTALDGLSVMAQYGEYQEFCRQRGYNISSLDTFREQVCDVLEYTTELDSTGTEKFMMAQEEE